MPWVRVTSLGDVRPGLSKRIVVGGRAIAVFNVEGTLYAVDDDCPHAEGGRLSGGTQEATSVWCPLHDACFDLVTGHALAPPEGEAMGPPMSHGVRVYQVEVVDGDIYLVL